MDSSCLNGIANLGSHHSLLLLAVSSAEKRVLSLLAAKLAASTDTNTGSESPCPDIRIVAKNMYERRLLRDQFFDPDIFPQPAWDMLLAAYCLSRSEKPLTVTGLCLASLNPQSTAMRWIDRLFRMGMLERSPSTADKRVVFVALTDEALHKIEAYLTRIAERCGELVYPLGSRIAQLPT